MREIKIPPVKAKGFFLNLRFWFIKLLAGKLTILFNATLWLPQNKEIDMMGGGYAYGLRIFEVDAVQDEIYDPGQCPH